MNTSKLSGNSADITEEQKDKLRKLFPEVFAEDKIDWQKLKAALGEEVELGERYGLSWKGKSDVFRVIQEPTTKTLKPVRDESLNFDETKNVFIEGDNLEALKVLQKAYYGKIKMIYIDPPYNTGNDFVYNDKFAQRRADYEQEAGLRDENGNMTRIDGLRKNNRDSGHYHSDWLNMLYPRLYLARNLMRQDGVIFASIDDNEIHNLRHMMDEIFGEENFVAQVVVQSNPRGRQSDQFFATMHEYLLVYARNIQECKLLGQSLTPEQVAEYKYIDDDGERYRLLGLRQRGVASLRSDRPEMFFPIYVNPNNSRPSLVHEEGFAEVLPKKSDGIEGRWMWGHAKVERDIQLLEAKLIAGRNEWDIFVRDYLNRDGDERTRKPKTVWNEKELNYQNGTIEVKDLFSGEKVMTYPKPVSLVRRIVDLATSNEDIVLDFFAGSGTTAHAVMQLNAEDSGKRRWIMVQLPESITDGGLAYKTIAEIAKERIRRASRKISSADASVDVGFRSLLISSTNFKIWDTAVRGEELKQQMLDHLNPVKEGSSEEDLLTELSLKSGIDPTVSPKLLKTTDGKYYLLDDSLAICLEARLSLALFDNILSAKPSRIILLDSSLHNDDQLKTNLLLQAEKANVEISVI
ncbi:MAG TPA: site-specific DNA-methyltransferase [Candidatus Saccharimonadia bacterium]|nr:site-specific DNA-methyltransferase [Candidatus Saccharimonadia bacterium]